MGNTQVDLSRTITVEFDANSRGPWDRSSPQKSSVQVHPGELTTVVYEFQNTQNQAHVRSGHSRATRRIRRQPISTRSSASAFNQYTLEPGEKEGQWPVVHLWWMASLSKDVKTITLSYTFFEVGSRTPPAAPVASDQATVQLAREWRVMSEPVPHVAATSFLRSSFATGGLVFVWASAATMQSIKRGLWPMSTRCTSCGGGTVRCADLWLVIGLVFFVNWVVAK